MNRQNRNRLTDTENRLMVARRRAFGELGEKGEGTKKSRSVVIKDSRDVKYSIGNIVNNNIIIRYGTHWVLEVSGGTLCKVHDCLTTMLHT